MKYVFIFIVLMSAAGLTAAEDKAAIAQMVKELAYFRAGKNDTNYRVMLGGGSYVDLAYLADAMGDRELAANFKWGSHYNTFKIGLTASILSGAAFDLLGGFFIYSYFGLFTDKNYPDDPYDASDSFYLNGGLLGSGIVLLSLSALSITGIIVFAVCMWKSFKYHYTSAEARSFIEKYNTFVRNKYGVVGFDIHSDRQGSMALACSIAF